jgi:DNA polymerase-3 subunit chi
LGRALFYHLTRRPLEQTLAMLLEKSFEAGLRVAVRGTDDARLDWLDAQLWLGPEERFLPHGRAGQPHAADQPVLLTTGAEAPNGARCLMVIDGAEVTAAEVDAMDRVCVLFDGQDPAAVERARGQWKSFKDAGAAAQYWSEESGRWEKKAET